MRIKPNNITNSETIDPKKRTIPRSPEFVKMLINTKAPEMKLIEDIFLTNIDSFSSSLTLNLIQLNKHKIMPNIPNIKSGSVIIEFYSPELK